MQQQCADCLLFESLTSRLLRLRPDREGIIKMSSGVCPSVCRVPQHNSRTERPTKPKFAGWKPFTRVSHKPIYLKVKRLKVNVTKPINAHTVNAKYLLNGKAYELQTWCTDGARRPASPRSKVKVARSRDASDRCWPISRQRNVLETPKLVGRLSTPRTITCNSFNVKGLEKALPLRLCKSESESECKCLTCNQKPTGSQFSLLHEPN